MGGRPTPLVPFIMLLSDSHKFAFYHYPKTGGSSITAALAPYLKYPINVPPTEQGGWQGRHHIDGIQHVPLKWVTITPPDDYLKAVFIRNPFEIVVSAWNIDQMPFDKFVHEEISTRQHPSLRNTILESITDESGIVQTDFIGRHENMEADWKRFCWTVGLPKLKLPYRNIKELKWNRPKNPDYRTHYTHYSREVVERVFGNDLKYFGYSLDN